jgi:hypothetical protein
MLFFVSFIKSKFQRSEWNAVVEWYQSRPATSGSVVFRMVITRCMRVTGISLRLLYSPDARQLEHFVIWWLDGLCVCVCVFVSSPLLATTNFPLIVSTPEASWRCVQVVMSRILLSCSVPHKYWTLMTLTGHLFYPPYRIVHRLRFVVVNAHILVCSRLFIWTLSIVMFVWGMQLSDRAKLLRYSQSGGGLKCYNIFGMFRCRLLSIQNSQVLKWPETITCNRLGEPSAPVLKSSLQ